MRRTTFPLEIRDEIIEYLHVDKAALTTCSLVCRAWATSSRRHLFGEVELPLFHGGNYGGRVRGFLKLLRSPNSIASFIRKVEVSGPFDLGSADVFDSLYQALIILRDTNPGYKSISFRDILEFRNIHEALPLSRLTEFTARDCCLKTFHDLSILLVTMPDLQRLELDRVGELFEDSEPISGTLLLPQLRTIKMLRFCVMDFLQFLAPPPNLHEVDFGGQPPADIPSVCKFLKSSASSLEDLYLDCSVDSLKEYCVALRAMTGIRSISLNIFTLSFEDWKWIPTILDNITSCAVDHVKFILYLYSGEGPVGSDLLLGVPAMMERPNFRRMRKLEFKLHGDAGSFAIVETWILHQLRGLDSDPRNILYISAAS